jgi:hypothetical protein
LKLREGTGWRPVLLNKLEFAGLAWIL